MTGDMRIAIPVVAREPRRQYWNYFHALEALGATPVAVDGSADARDFDGLLLPGGGDVDPGRYRQAVTLSEDIDPVLDAAQFGALDAFVKAGKPVLGICRGHQVINVYFGGSLIQHLPQSDRHSRCGQPEDKAHAVEAEAGSVLAALYGPRFFVNSAHHQGVDKLGDGLRVTARADDGVIEATEHASLPILTVQFHPERMCLDHARADTVDGSVVIGRFLEIGRGR